MYSLVLTLHSLLRWVVIVFAVLALVRAFGGWLGKKGWTPTDRMAAIGFTTALDVQFLVGLLLYVFYSPLTKSALQDFGNAMSNALQRFFALEHVLLMLIAVVVAHIGSSRARKAADDVAKHKQTAIFFGVAVLLVLLAIPWPFLDYGRPLFRFG